MRITVNLSLDNVYGRNVDLIAEVVSIGASIDYLGKLCKKAIKKEFPNAAVQVTKRNDILVRVTEEEGDSAEELLDASYRAPNIVNRLLTRDEWFIFPEHTYQYFEG